MWAYQKAKEHGMGFTEMITIGKDYEPNALVQGSLCTLHPQTDTCTLFIKIHKIKMITDSCSLSGIF